MLREKTVVWRRISYKDIRMEDTEGGLKTSWNVSGKDYLRLYTNYWNRWQRGHDVLLKDGTRRRRQRRRLNRILNFLVKCIGETETSSELGSSIFAFSFDFTKIIALSHRSSEAYRCSLGLLLINFFKSINRNSLVVNLLLNRLVFD